MLQTIDKRSAGGEAAVLAGSQECLTFRLADEEYGTDILKVQQIRGLGRRYFGSDLACEL